MVYAFEIFNAVTGKTVRFVATEEHADELCAASTEPWDYSQVVRSQCYCDSAYHAEGH